MAKKKKFRADFRKNHESRVRRGDLTRDFARDGDQLSDLHTSERVSGKGDLTRKRTLITGDDAPAATGDSPSTTDQPLLRGRVLRVFGLESVVQLDDGREFRCATRRLLKSLSTDLRHVVATGDQTWIRPDGIARGFIERIEPRRNVLSRTSRGRQHVLVANVDQLVIVASVAQPSLKPNLIDRYLLTAEKIGVEPVVCFNKVDLVDATELQPLMGVYGQMGYRVLGLSAVTGQGIQQLQHLLAGKETVFSGQSGVGKSSLLNVVEPGLGLRVREVSEENEKGKHTTTTASLIPLSFGGFVVDTPGIRQFQLWDVIPAEVAGFYRDLRPYVNLCRFPDCSHTHEAGCAVKDAVADGRLNSRRYESYCQIRAGDDE